MRTSFHHQPEAQHPNFPLSTSRQADNPSYRGRRGPTDPAGCRPLRGGQDRYPRCEHHHVSGHDGARSPGDRMPRVILFANDEWHPETQWLLRATDLTLVRRERSFIRSLWARSDDTARARQRPAHRHGRSPVIPHGQGRMDHAALHHRCARWLGIVRSSRGARLSVYQIQQAAVVGHD
jgi:hypothetical protein